MLLTFGLAFIIEEVIKLFYGDSLVSYQMPNYMRFAAFTIFETNYPFYRLFMGAVALAMFAALYLLLTRTRVGIVVRAATYRPTTVEALGHNLPLVYMGVFAGGSALAGLAGAVAGAFYPTGPSMAVDFGTLVFVVVVIGGLGSVVGALVASLMIGLFISFSVGLNCVDRRPARPGRARAVGARARRALHPAALDRRQQHAVHAHVARPAHPPGRPDGGPPVIKTRTIVLLAGLAGHALLILPLFLSPNLLNAAIKMMIAALFALAFTLAMGQAGMLSFGHAAYYGLGAFAALHLMRAVEQKLFGFPTPLIPLAGALVGFVFGLVFGWFATQRTGVYFSMVTLALAELLLTLAPTWNSVFGGESGISTMRGARGV